METRSFQSLSPCLFKGSLSPTIPWMELGDTVGLGGLRPIPNSTCVF